MRRTKEDAEQTRRAILASAMDMFYEKGYSKTTFDGIAARINLTKGAVYWYFRNKPDMVAALINYFAGAYLEELKKFSADRGVKDFDDITAIVLFNNKKLREDPVWYKFLFFVTCQMEWSDAILSKIQPTVEDTKRAVCSLFQSALKTLQKNGKIREDVDINMVCEILGTFYEGAKGAYFAKYLTYDFDELVKNGFTLIFNNIKTEGVKNEN